MAAIPDNSGRRRPVLRSGLASKTALAAAILATLLLTTACATDSEHRSPVFFEPDGWWSIPVPDGWEVKRVELDGTKTRLRHRSPSPTPTRDTEAHRVVYELERPSKDSLDTSASRIGISAVPDREPDELATSMAESLGAPVESTTCYAGSCSSIRLESENSSTAIVFVPAPGQRRTYVLKATLPRAADATEREQVSAAVAAFEPGKRSS